MAFDSIMEKYDLEKIKTIGDSYMCAGNIPSPDPNHVFKIIKAAMEMQDFMEKHSVRRAEKGTGGMGNKDRCTCRAGSGGCSWQKEICLRYLGQHSEHRKPHGK